LGYLETRSDGAGELRQLQKALGWPGTLVANLGLTSWGRSGVRNFLGYFVLGMRVRRQRKTLILIHNLIEALDTETVGYPVSGFTRWGAHRAVAFLRGATVVSFSVKVGDLLKTAYRTQPALVTPIPCPPVRDPGSPRDDPPRVITPGYLSPYKGHEQLPSIRPLVVGEAKFTVVGGVHRVLAENDPTYRRNLDDLQKRLIDSGVEVRGWVSDPELNDLLGRSSVALLPYSSTQGGSAMFSRIASAGLPVVATDLPEFRWLESRGAGVLCVPRSPQGYAEGVSRLLSDRALHRQLVERQKAFAQAHSWEAFLGALRALGELDRVGRNDASRNGAIRSIGT
jgi:glycosyltransferase involved in cell wall biosynthesis